MHGKSKNAEITDIDKFKIRFENFVNNYDPKDIFNIDETGIYIRNIGTKSYVLSKRDNKGTKLSKARISVMLGINMYNEKLPLLVVGKSKNPRCFETLNIWEEFACYHHANNSCWGTKNILKNYLDCLNEKLITDQRKILILSDNFTEHVVPESSNKKLCFLPPNSTSTLQPLNQGVIHSFKSIYKNFLNRFITFNRTEPKIL